MIDSIQKGSRDSMFLMDSEWLLYRALDPMVVLSFYIEIYFDQYNKIITKASPNILLGLS